MFCTHFTSYLVKFDPVKRAFTFSCETKPQMALGMTEDDQGIIFASGSHLHSYMVKR